ncbi:MAG: serine/threonine-protein kinase [Kofleriaceae bacterium]|nr:serine/threonine-protein kinase [Kofleriaceae bacterium]
MTMEGSSIGPYRIVRLLGEGGMGAVWLGEHTLLGRRAAIKVLLPEYTTNDAIVQRFFNEARAVTAIADPGIVQVFDFGNANGLAYIVMELLEGEAMDARLRRIGRFAPADAVRLMAQIATSLGAAHKKGVIHRDLKPENIFIVGDPAVTGGERTKVLDFGIAKLAGNELGQSKTRTGLVMGTPVYMSPEQCRGAATIDARSDIYSLGCVLFTMLCGRPPFESEGSGDLIIMHVRDIPPAPSSLVPGLVPEIDAFMARCLEKDPNRRFQSTAEMVQGLAAVEAALFGIPADDGFRQSLQMPAVGGGYTTSPGTSPGQYRARMTPAAALAYRQHNTGAPAAHDARTRIATPTGGVPLTGSGIPSGPYAAHHSGPTPTTLGNATGAVQTEPKRKTGLIAGLAIGLIAIGGIVVAVAGGGGGASGEKNETVMPATTPTTPTPAAAPPDAAPVAVTIDAAPVAVTVDAAPVAVEPPDAAPVAVDTTPPDAGVAAATKPVDDKVAGEKRDKRRPPKRGGTKQGGSNASSSGTGTIDRGD